MSSSSLEVSRFGQRKYSRLIAVSDVRNGVFPQAELCCRPLQLLLLRPFLR